MVSRSKTDRSDCRMVEIGSDGEFGTPEKTGEGYID